MFSSVSLIILELNSSSKWSWPIIKSSMIQVQDVQEQIQNLLPVCVNITFIMQMICSKIIKNDISVSIWCNLLHISDHHSLTLPCCYSFQIYRRLLSHEWIMQHKYRVKIFIYAIGLPQIPLTIQSIPHTR